MWPLITSHYWLMSTIIHAAQNIFITIVICFSVKTNGFRQDPSLLARQGAATPVSRSQKTPAATPKRESPATIAAKEAPGWEKFLGVKSQTVSFTSEEATKFRTARDESRNRTGAGAKREEVRGREEHHHRDRSRQQHIQRRDVLNNFFHKMEENNRVVTESKTSRQLTPSSENQITPRTRREEARSGNKKHQGVRNSGSDENHNQSSASPEADKQQTLHLSRERSLKSISNWWKNSLETGPSPPHWGHDASGDSPSPRHNHSHSDSGISSMSGRSSCMSPMSELSSSSGSSRTSLRSSSIVSASNIVLEEEGETEVEYTDLCRELLLFAASDSRIVGLISKSPDKTSVFLDFFREILNWRKNNLMSILFLKTFFNSLTIINEIRIFVFLSMLFSGSFLTPWLQVYFPENSLEFEIITVKENCDSEPLKKSRSTNFEEARKNLLKHACARIDTQRKHQQLLKESTKNNEEVGREILSQLKDLSQQQEIDKVKLFTEEVDKITSLIIGLSSRLVKVSASGAKMNSHPDEKLQVKYLRNLDAFFGWYWCSFLTGYNFSARGSRKEG